MSGGSVCSPEWERAAQRAYGLAVHRVECPAGAATLLGPRRWWGRAPISTAPYATDGGVTFGAGAPATWGPALHEVRARAGASCALLKTRRPLMTEPDPSIVVDRSHVGFRLDLEGGADAVWTTRLNTKVRNQTRKGLRQALQLRVGHLERLHDFFSVLSECWRDLGTPMHHVGFFRSLLEELGPERSQVVQLDLDGHPVAVALLVVQGDTVHHPYAASLRRVRSLSINNVLYWRIVEWGAERGLRWFDLGRSPNVDGGTARYKRSWGAEEIDLYYHYVLGPGATVPARDTPLVKLAVRAWQRLPVPVANRLGPALIRGVL